MKRISIPGSFCTKVLVMAAAFSIALHHAPLNAYAGAAGGEKDQAVLCNKEGVALANSGKYREAVEKLEEAAALDPANKQIKTNLFMVLNAYAVSSSKSGNGGLTYEIYEKALQMEDVPYNIPMNFGTFLMNQGKFEEAGAHLEKALTLPSVKKEDEESIRLSLAHSYLKRGFYDESISHLDQVISKNPKSGEAYFTLGKVYYTQGKFQNAVENLQLAVRSGGPFATAAADLLKKVQKEGKVESGFETQSLHHFQVQFDGEKRNDVKLDSVMQILEEAYSGVGSYFNYYPEAPTPVIVYSKSQFKEASDSPVWVAALYDGKIRIPLNDIVQNSDILKSLIFHEYTHAVIFQITRGRCPVWLNEGFAQILEGETSLDKKVANVKKYLSRKQVFDMTGLEGSFMGISPPAAVELAYDQSLLFTNFVIEKVGQSQLIDALQLLAQGKSMSSVMEEDLYTSYKKLQEEWLENVSK